jgi:CheY-like chemotaxis protein
MRLGILVVEDDRDLRKTMCENLAYEHPGVTIDPAETVNRAVELLRTALARGVHYIIVILDIKLPRETGGAQAFHLDLRDQVLASASSDAYIFYVSSHLGNPVIQEYKRRLEAQIENNVQAPRTFFFSKSRGDDVHQFYKKINQVMHTRRIREMLKGIMPVLLGTSGFAPVGAGEMVYSAPRDPFTYAGADPTHQLADLARDIEAHWDYLESNLQEIIRQYFVVTKTQAGVDVSLV